MRFKRALWVVSTLPRPLAASLCSPYWWLAAGDSHGYAAGGSGRGGGHGYNDYSAVSEAARAYLKAHPAFKGNKAAVDANLEVRTPTVQVATTTTTNTHSMTVVL